MSNYNQTERLLHELNRLRGHKPGKIGYCFYSKFMGNGQVQSAVYQVVNVQGDITYAPELNGDTPRERCTKIRIAIHLARAA